MTRKEIQEILKTPFYDRVSKGLPRLPWEHCAKKFYKIPNNLALEHLMGMTSESSKNEDDPMILLCKHRGEAYYFGIGLENCEKMSLSNVRILYKRGTWYVYTWSD